VTKCCILLVDDEANVLKSLKRLFVDTDYRVLTASSGQEGLDICARESVSLVISDYRMSEMTGVQFLAEVKKLYPNTIRIILSGYADVEAIVEAINDGQVYKFLSKPWNDQEILTTVQRSLEHYSLREENSALLSELQTANQELKKLTNSLELKVDERSRDLVHKNRALETAQRLLNLLPAGVIGIDTQGTLVYMNRATENFVDTEHLVLGDPVDWQLANELLRFLKEALDDGKVTCGVDDSKGGVRVICAPLPDQAGVVGLFTYTDLEHHSDEKTSRITEEEVANAD